MTNLALYYKIGIIISSIYFAWVINKRASDGMELVMTSIGMALVWPLTLPADIIFNILDHVETYKRKHNIVK